MGLVLTARNLIISIELCRYRSTKIRANRVVIQGDRIDFAERLVFNMLPATLKILQD
jgi:hypothetical protein